MPYRQSTLHAGLRLPFALCYISWIGTASSFAALVTIPARCESGFRSESLKLNLRSVACLRWEQSLFSFTCPGKPALVCGAALTPLAGRQKLRLRTI